MEIKKCVKESFSVIGKEGSTNDGNDFVQKLWGTANAHFEEVASLAKKDGNGNILGIWGVMSDFSRKFNPWEDNFTKGLYLAGVEVVDEAQPPQGWVKWTIPSYEYFYVKVENQNTFAEVIKYLGENDIKLAGAVHDFICPEENGQCYMFFPIRKLSA
jgi:predicted transcriptional regulator YdeE